MLSVIDPSADEVWNSVATIVDASGVHENFPRTDEDWAAVRIDAIRLIEPTFLGPARRLWASRLYQISRTRHLAWWALSLPVRMNVHKPGKMKRFAHSIRQWLQRPR